MVRRTKLQTGRPHRKTALSESAVRPLALAGLSAGVVLLAAISFTEPFHAEDLLAKAREIDRLISLATVYRTLPMLLDSRLIREVELNREHRYYEVNREQSPAAFHIVCTDCGQVFQVQDECITLRERFLANRLGFKPS